MLKTSWVGDREDLRRRDCAPTIILNDEVTAQQGGQNPRGDTNVFAFDFGVAEC
jgi:hypothetical protein